MWALGEEIFLSWLATRLMYRQLVGSATLQDITEVTILGLSSEPERMNLPHGSSGDGGEIRVCFWSITELST